MMTELVLRQVTKVSLQWPYRKEELSILQSTRRVAKVLPPRSNLEEGT